MSKVTLVVVAMCLGLAVNTIAGGKCCPNAAACADGEKAPNCEKCTEAKKAECDCPKAESCAKCKMAADKCECPKAAVEAPAEAAVKE